MSSVGTRLLGGPSPSQGYERLGDHLRRLGARPRGSPRLVEVLKHSGLRGRGGAWFPTWRKWAAVANRSDGHSVVVVNGSEGEPLSAKDRVLLQLRPHLVLDGAALAAEALGADDVVLYLSRSSRETEQVVSHALREREERGERPVRVERTAHRYVAGESSAVVSRVSGGQSKPRFTLHRSADRGVNDQPTLVQNAETLAHVAMIARYGGDWFRQLGTPDSPGTTLMTLCGNLRHPGVYEVDLRATVWQVISDVGGTVSPPAGALIGGYFGTWLAPPALESLPLDVDVLRSKHGAAFGCGVLAVLPQGGCAIVESTRILMYLAAETAGQCGPCINGLAALADAMQRIASSSPESGDIDRVWRWIEMVRGRGACHHPDGAVGQLSSALTGFKQHLSTHLVGHRCYGASTAGFPPPPMRGNGWK
ncbi:MAG TPA: NADH-ubiquinone oxidoreductase-F iron-sulfur binding region domain-containing protein [Candidatus Limnocylindrales bacterium]|nr:NADH-ubiquinone oxidoreductase-F iron-sulfur binding region domain-containing protein [Candidatus Limnocylindrales bacterium]